MAINLASKASAKVAERFNLASCTEGLFSTKYDWTGVATVRVYSVDVLSLNNYDRTASSARFGTLTEIGDTYQEMTVTDDKSFSGSIDKGNNTSQLMIKAASSVLKRETDEVIIPYIDKYRLNKLATGAGIVYALTAAPTSANAIATFLGAGAAMSNQLVPKAGRVLFIGETAAINIKLASQVIGVDSLAEKVIVNGVIGGLDGMQIRIVPDSYMPTGCTALIVRKGAAVAPKKVETYRVIEEDKDVDGSIVQGRFLHDCFVLDASKKGVLSMEVVTNGGGYAYAPVLTPAANPYTAGYYKKSATGFAAVPSTETTVQANTVYYERLG